MKYSIEGNVDFFKELHEMQNSIKTTDEDENNTCLLSGDKLRPDSVELQCGHKFNYVPLFTEVVLQKCAILPKNISSSMTASYVNNQNIHNEVVTHHYNSSLNLETTKLSYNDVKCPYCRTVTPYLLPYYPYPDIKQIRYVNTPSNLCMPGVKCCYYASKSIEKECSNAPTYDDKHGLLCKTHLRCVVTATMNSDKVKKTKSKRVTNDISDTNMIIMSIKDKPSDGCGYILTTGARKGCQCGAKAYNHNHNQHDTATTENVIVSNNTSSNNDVVLLCKRHYSMTHK
jgi:hypothetical protein